MKRTLHVKDPDALFRHQGSCTQEDIDTLYAKWFKFGEYYTVEIIVDPETGVGTCQFKAPQ